jgi:hypothetical protein
MKKVVRLTEADLARIVKRVIKEQAPTDVYNPSTMGRVSGEPRMDKPKSNEFDWKSHFDQIKNELDSYLNTIEGPVDVKRFQSKVRNAYYGMVSNVDDEYSYPSHGDDFIQLTDEYMSYFRNKLKNLVQKYGKLTEADLTRIIKRVIKEQSNVKEGRNNPNWINLVSKLKNLTYSPKVLTFNSYDVPPIQSQSLNWGTAKGPNGKYAFAIPSTDSTGPEERIILFNSDDGENQIQMHNWWKKRGYTINGEDISINFKDADKLRNDIESFFKVFPPQ